MNASIPLFSYGTLQQREVQLATYGRLLDGDPDALIGYRLEKVQIGRHDVVEISGKAVHTIAHRTASRDDYISGTLYWLTEAELGAADAYEDAAYTRIEVTLASGRTAWIYVDASAEERHGTISP